MKAKIFTLFLFVSLIAPKLDAQTVLFQEDFTGGGNWAAINNPSKWFNKIVEGSGRVWSTLTGVTSTAPVAFSYNRTAGADSWLVTATQIDLSSTTNSYQFELSFGLGYYVANEPFRFHVLMSETFDGANPLNGTWTDITNLFQTTENTADGTPAGLSETVKTPPSAGYPGSRLYRADLSSFAGKKVHLAFRDMLLPIKTSGTYATASLHLIDNIKVSSYPSTGVNNIDNELLVWSSDESIHVKTISEAKISIHDVSGKMILSNTTVNNLFSMKVSKGLYIIKINDEVRKILVK